MKLAHRACSVRQSTSSIKFPEAEEFVGWGDGVGTQGQENQPVAGPLTPRLCQGGSTCGDTVPPSLIPALSLCPQRAWHISLRGSCGNVPWWSRLSWSNWPWKGHSSQGNLPVIPKWVLLFFCSPLPHGSTRRKRLQGMRCGNSPFPLCLAGAGGSCRNDAPSIHVVHGQHRLVATKVPDFPPVDCLEHSTVGTQYRGLSIVFWPLKNYLHGLRVH